MMKVFIDDVGCRSQAMGLPHLYSKIGCEVFMLAPGEFSDEWLWDDIPVWPRLLYKPNADANERNLAAYPHFRAKYGEDVFLETERTDLLATNYEGPGHVTLVTQEQLKILGPEIDIYHTAEFCKRFLEHRVSWGEKWLPNAKWISSCFSPADVGKGHPGTKQPENVCILMPSPCEHMFSGSGKNQFWMYRHPFEFELLGVDTNQPKNPNLVSSFMHNFHVRDPEYYRLFVALQQEVAKYGIEIVNFGANIRSVGADTRYSGGGPSGSSFVTLSPRKAGEKYFQSRAILHLKGLDWAGGVPAHAAFSGTPFITTSQFLTSSNYAKLYNIDTGTVSCDTPDQLLNTILNVVKNDALHTELHRRMSSMLQERIFTDDYWAKFASFIGNAR